MLKVMYVNQYEALYLMIGLMVRTVRPRRRQPQ